MGYSGSWAGQQANPPSYSQVSPPSYSHSGASGAFRADGSGPHSVGGRHGVTGPHPAGLGATPGVGPQSVAPQGAGHSAPPSGTMSGTHPSVTHISSITDASVPQRGKTSPWLWVLLAALTGGAVALGLWLFLERGRSTPTASSAVAANGTTTVPTDASSTGPTPSATASQATSDPAPTQSSVTSSTPSGKVPSTPTANVPRPTATPTDTAEESTGPGMIQVVCSPWGNVSIDGRPVGMTPIGAVSVPPGQHTVSATNSDLGASRAQTVKVVSGKTSFVKFDFKKAGE